MRKLILLITFFIITPIFLILSSYFLLRFSNANSTQILLGKKNENKAPVYAALPSVQDEFIADIIQSDIRVENVKQFLARYNSPLAPFAQNIVSSADSNNIDYRLIPAIAMQESNLCAKVPKNSYNCWGFGVYGNKVKRFENYGQAIEAVTKTLAQNYIQGGLQTPEEIMKKYTPSNDGSWAKSVNFFMNQL
ncbi:MAG: hypothetical protein ABH816_03530 [Candidatus Levyibacteriota bacterium]